MLPLGYSSSDSDCALTGKRGVGMNQEHSRIPALDAVRGIAILMVIATHSLSATVAVTGSYNIPYSVFWIFANGQFGVQLFFVLSGWLMFSLYTGGKSFSRKLYWSRRWARIWPLWIVFVVATFLFLGNPNPEGNLWLSLAISIFFLGWLTPALVAVPTGGLTIQQEMGHYALFAIFRKRSAAFLALTVIVGYALAWLANYFLPQVPPDSFAAWVLSAWLRLGLYGTWPFFLLGGLGLVLYRKWSLSGFSNPFPDSVKTPLLIGIAIVLFGLSTYGQDIASYFVLGYVFFGVLLALALNGIPGIGSAVRSIGRYSYFMYFFHFWVLRWLEALYRRLELPGNDQTSEVWNIGTLLVIWIVTTFLSWIVGWVSWRILENPVMKITKKYVR